VLEHGSESWREFLMRWVVKMTQQRGKNSLVRPFIQWGSVTVEEDLDHVKAYGSRLAKVTLGHAQTPVTRAS
jgi:hypothetical protein